MLHKSSKDSNISVTLINDNYLTAQLLGLHGDPSGLHPSKRSRVAPPLF